MKNRNLVELGLIELNSKELHEYEGGSFWSFLGIFVTIYDAWSDFMEGFTEAQLKKDHKNCT